MALPILPSTTDLRSITERGNVLIKDYNREDKRVPLYALDTGSATAYAIAPIPGIELYRVGDIFVFKAANANSGATPTLAVNGLTAGTITKIDGSALVAGDIPANGFIEVVVTAATPTFALLTPPAIPIVNSGSTTFVATSNVAISSVPATPTSIVNTGSIGASGQVWAISACGTFACTSAAAIVTAAISNGSAAIIGGEAIAVTSNQGPVITLGPVVVTLSAATTFSLLAATNGVGNTSAYRTPLVNTTFSPSLADKMTSITAQRLS